RQKMKKKEREGTGPRHLEKKKKGELEEDTTRGSGNRREEGEQRKKGHRDSKRRDLEPKTNTNAYRKKKGGILKEKKQR
ncbi:unnamed protein product, partial [Bubo scandiacus]